MPQPPRITDKAGLLQAIPVFAPLLQVPEQTVLVPTTTAHTQLVRTVPGGQLIPTRPRQVKEGETKRTPDPIGLAQGLDVRRTVPEPLARGGLLASTRRRWSLGPARCVIAMTRPRQLPPPVAQHSPQAKSRSLAHGLPPAPLAQTRIRP